jgi:hypothetical protein
MNDVTIDVFGYEKKVIENITSYLETISNANKVPPNHINIRISKPAGELEVSIHYLDSLIKKVSLKELIHFFMGSETAGLFNIEEKIKNRVRSYLQEFSKENNIGLEALNIRISKPKDKVLVVAYNSAEYVTSIPLKELIKQFK